MNAGERHLSRFTLLDTLVTTWLMVRPGQSVIYNYSEKLETEHLLNLRASEVDVEGVNQLRLLGNR